MQPPRNKGFGCAAPDDESPRKHARRKPGATVLAALLALLVTGCSSFHREWRQAAQSPAPTDSPAGRWEGRWRSDANQHSGKLRFVLVPQSPTNSVAHFHATYWKIFRASYTVSLAVQEMEDGWCFHGEENLGRFAGGVYRYAGSASATNFFSTYESKYDHGTFELRRPDQ